MRQNREPGLTAQFRRPQPLTRLIFGLYLALLGQSPAEAATFGVPTRIGTDGRVCTGNNVPAGIGCTAAALDPPGWLLQTGVDDVDAAGDTVHQMRLFIEVTGTTLDVRVFDAGRSGIHDEPQGDNTTHTFQLISPTGAVLKTIAWGADNATTEGRLARMSSVGADTFTTLNAGSAFTGLTPGRFELRVTASNGSSHDDRNAFGVDIRSGTAANAAHYNVYTFGIDDDAGAGTSAGANDTSLIIGSLQTGDPAQEGSITQGMPVYAYVTRGCSLSTSNFDMDGHATASASITSVLGASTALTVSGGTLHSENTATIHTSGIANGAQADVNNYGVYLLQNNTGTQFNIIDWRIADFRGYSDNPANLPPDTIDPLRTYLPNGYTGGVPPASNATPPVEPALTASYAYVSGANPPAVGQVTRFVVQVELGNPGPAAILLNAATDQIVSGLPTGATGLGNIRCFRNSYFTTAGTAVNGGTFARCNFSGANVTLNGGDSAYLTYQFNMTPAAGGAFFITNVPAAPAAGTYDNGALAPNSTTWAQFSRYPGGTVRAETLGPVCDLRATTGLAVTRATISGVRVDPSGSVEFATLGQRRTAGFNIYSTSDRSGRGARTRLNDALIPSPVPDSLEPILYKAATAPISAPYILIEEIETTGRARLLGPFRIGDTKLREAMARTERHPRVPSGLFARGAERAARRGTRTAIARRPARVRAEATSIRVEVDTPGRVQVSLGELQGAGLSARFRARHLHVYNQGTEVPVEIVSGADGEALLFDNFGLETAYTARNVFVVSAAKQGPPMRADLTWFDAPAARGTVRAEQDRYYAPAAPRGTDPWIWDFVVGGEPWPRVDDPDAGRFDLPELDATPGAVLPVRIRMASALAGFHTVDAEINGVSVGSVSFSGQKGATLQGEIPVEDLQTTGNSLTLTYSADPSSGGLVYLSYVEVGAAALHPPRVSPVELSALRPALPAMTQVDYLIVSHPDFLSQAHQLAGLKAQEGFRVQVVDIEQVYDGYTGGIVEAQAIARLIADVARSRKLKFVLLVGDDSFDSQNILGNSSPSLIPSVYAWDPEFGRIPSEGMYADVNGDSLPDVAIGRLPVQNAAEAAAMVEKIGRHGSAPPRGGRQVFGVDNQAAGDPPFEALAARAASTLPGRPIAWARVANGIDEARVAFRQGLATGVQAAHFFGHGAFESWADEQLLSVDDVPELNTSPQTVVFSWACESQWFQWPSGPSLGEALVLLPAGGALASFGPSGITDPDAQSELMAALYPRAFKKGAALGEAIRLAKIQALRKSPGRLGTVVHGWNLLGDPSLRLEK